MKEKLSKHPLIKTIIEVRGNTRVALYSEPLWGLSLNLCLPFASVYMLALGLDDIQVGIVTSIFLFSQMIFAFLSGAIIDKMGRRKSTAIFDFLAWSIPSVIWAVSQDFWFFVVAALFNGAMRVPAVAYGCLLIEDAPKNKTTQIYTWVTIASNLSALFAPISSLLVSKLTLIPAVRILYVNAFIIMTIKIIILYKLSTETEIGKVKIEESRNKSLVEMLAGYKTAFKKITTSKGTKFSVVISMIVEITVMIGMTFWQIIASRRIGVPDELLPIFPMVKSFLSLIMLFTIVSKIRQSKLRLPLYTGFVSYIISAVILISIKGTSVFGYILLFVSIFFEALGVSTLNTLRESLVAIHVDPTERSSIMALLQTTVMLVSIPFGYIAGRLSNISRMLPFVLIIALLFIGMFVTTIFYNKEEKKRKSVNI